MGTIIANKELILESTSGKRLNNWELAIEPSIVGNVIENVQLTEESFI